MSFHTIKALEALLKQGFNQTVFRQPDKEPGVYVPPTFFIGGLPPKRKRNDPDYEPQSDFPFIVNRFMEGTDSEEESIVTIKTLCGIYTAGDVESGENDIANMVFRCRRLILGTRFLDARYELELPLRWTLGDAEDQHNQPYPYYGGEIISRWTIPTIEQCMTPEEEVRIYGSGQ
jgi:hypothetical protein